MINYFTINLSLLKDSLEGNSFVINNYNSWDVRDYNRELYAKKYSICDKLLKRYLLQ